MRSGQKVAHANIAGGLERGRAAGRKSAPRKSRDAVVINSAGGSRKVAAAKIAIKQGGSTSRGDGRDLLSRKCRGSSGARAGMRGSVVAKR